MSSYATKWWRTRSSTWRCLYGLLLGPHLQQLQVCALCVHATHLWTDSNCVSHNSPRAIDLHCVSRSCSRDDNCPLLARLCLQGYLIFPCLHADVMAITKVKVYKIYFIAFNMLGNPVCIYTCKNGYSLYSSLCILHPSIPLFPLKSNQHLLNITFLFSINVMCTVC